MRFPVDDSSRAMASPPRTRARRTSTVATSSSQLFSSTTPEPRAMATVDDVVGQSACGALPGLRWDAPARLARTRGSFPDLSRAEDRLSAVEEFDKDVYAASSAPAVKARRKLIARFLHVWEWIPAY